MTTLTTRAFRALRRLYQRLVTSLAHLIVALDAEP